MLMLQLWFYRYPVLPSVAFAKLQFLQSQPTWPMIQGAEKFIQTYLRDHRFLIIAEFLICKKRKKNLQLSDKVSVLNAAGSRNCSQCMTMSTIFLAILHITPKFFKMDT